MLLPNLKKCLDESHTGVQFADMLPVFLRALPPAVEFENHIWDLIAWMRRRGNRKSANVFFNKYQNGELAQLVKIYILFKRETKRVDRGVAELAAKSMLALDKTLGMDRSALSLNNEDFANAQLWLEQKFVIGTAFRASTALQEFGSWLSNFLNLRITYRTTLKSPSYHGRKANQDGRNAKLVPTDVLRDLMSAYAREDLILKDRFFLSALCIDMACGFRINELTTLPADCLVEEEGQVGIRYFPEKSGKLGVRWIPSSMVPTVRKSLEFITEITEPGRELARVAAVSSDGYRWRDIMADQEAACYFVAKVAHEWTARPEHILFNKAGAWFDKENRYVDVIGALGRNRGNKSLAARELGFNRNTFYRLLEAQESVCAGRLPLAAKTGGERSSWDTDSRVFSMNRLIKLVGVQLKEDKRVWLRDIVEDAQKHQISGKVYPAPASHPELESKFRFTGYPPLIVDKDQNPVLEANDVLFILPLYALSEQRGTKSAEISYVDDHTFARWLSGEKRSRGTKNSEDSCFSRLDITDPRSGEIATFDWHDLRHWLNTMYQKGGLSDDMIALIFGRKASSNYVYDQTDMDTRVSRLQDSIRKGQMFGHLATTYAHLAEHSRDEAEQYLAARTIMINPMPHGLCTNNWSATPCPHHLGCFSGNHEKSDGVCEHLEVEPEDSRSIEEVKRINQGAKVAVEVIPPNSPQYAHFIRVEKNTHDLLNQLNKTREDH